MGTEENENRIWSRRNLSYCLAWSRTKQAWVVYKDFAGHQSELRVHDTREDADADFDGRVAEFEERYRRVMSGGGPDE